MTDQTKNNIARELREAEKFESELTRLFESLQPPFAASDRLLARLDGAGFHESELTLNDAGPYSFEQAVAEREAAGSDLLAAGLEEQEIDEPLDNEASDEEA